MLSIRNGSSRVPLAPLASLFALFVLAMTWVVSSRICARPVAMPMPMGASSMAMDGMPAPAGVMLCPVVIVLLVLSTALAAWALLAMWRDPHRAHDATNVVRTIARLPVLPTVGILVTAGAIAAGAIVAVDGGGPLSLASCLTLAALLGAMALAATLGSLAISRIVLALCVRLLLAACAAIAERPDRASACLLDDAPRARAVPWPIDFGRGLRAPPSPVR
jgi:hypothetical protein